MVLERGSVSKGYWVAFLRKFLHSYKSVGGFIPALPAFGYFQLLADVAVMLPAYCFETHGCDNGENY